ncbi:RHS repeat-associated core domain-containing protein [Streptosporangium subroseum]|uniref:RHS repeat-associated core domain-containing protein n=1 Tax=Streptosporangium subroseum TaxID=106412 RepID=UPI00309080C7|nr:polymorphic toxin-type HINT domain-containing protein [Streptosporangium subroseum]
MSGFARGKFVAILIGLSVVISPLPALGQNATPPAASRTIAPAAFPDHGGSSGSPLSTKVAGPPGKTVATSAAADVAGPAVYAYDAAGMLTGVTHSGGEAAKYGYDQAGNLTGIQRYPATQLSVMSAVPISGRPGSTVRVSGTGFSATPSGNAVSFNGAAATVTAATATTLTVTVPSNVTTGAVTVTVGGTTAQAGTFTVAAPGPAITTITPVAGPPTTEVTVTGSGFASALPENIVSVNGVRAEVTSATATQLKFVVSQGTTTGKLMVATPAGETTSSTDFLVPLPSVDPATIESTTRVQVGGPAQPILISGAGKSALVVFDAPASGEVDLGLTGNTLGSLTATGYSYLGRKLDSIFVSSGESLRLSGLAEGRTYELLIDPSSATATGQVTVTASEPIGGVLSPTGAGTVLNLARPGQRGVLTFSGTADSLVSVGFSAASISSLLHVSVQAPNGSMLVSNQFISAGTAGEVDLPKLPISGVYQVLVEPSLAGTGSVTVTLSNTVAGGVLSPTGAGSTATIARPGQDAAFTFTGTADATVSLGFTGTTIDKLWSVDVVAPDGTMVVDGRIYSAGGSGELDLPKLPVSGTYRVVVDPTAAGTGAVTVTLSAPVAGGVLSPTGTASVATIARPGQDATFTFTGTADTAMSLGLTANTFGKTIYLDVVAPDGTVVVDNQYLSSTTSGEIDIEKLPQTGTYQVLIDPDQASTGAVTLTLSKPVTGTLTPTGAGTVATIARPGQDATFTFAGTADGAVSLGLTANTLPKSAYVNVIAPDGTITVKNFYVSSASADEIDIEKLPQTGTYRVVIDPDQAVTGSITTTLSTPVAGGLLSPTGSAPVVAIARPGQDATFTFAGTADGAVSLGLTANTLPKSAYVNVIAPDGTITVKNFYVSSASADEIDIAKLPQTGTYRVVIDPDQAAIGSITTTLSKPVTGALTPTGAGVAAAIARAGQDAVLTFAGTTGAAVSIGLTPNSVNQATYVNVLAPDGTIAVKNYYVSSATADEIDIAKLPQTGTYQVVIDPMRAGTGSVTATLSNRVAAGTLALGGAAVNATIARAGQDAAYTFTGTAAQKVKLAVTGVPSFTAAVYVGVIKPDGTQLSNSYVSANTTLNVADLPAAGTYTVVIDPTKGLTGQIGIALATRTTALAPAATASTPAPANTAPSPSPSAVPAARPASLSGEKPADGDTAWKPDKGNLEGVDWNARRAVPAKVEPLRAPAGVTALSGVIRTIDGKPLPKVALTIGRVTGTTDGKGRFLLTGLPTGTSTLDVDGAPAGAKGRRYGFYSVKVDMAAGRTTVLPYTIWMQQIDTQHMVRFDSPAGREVVLTTPKIPGLEVRIPAGSVIRDKAGKVITELGITPIPVDRPPFPLPPNGIVPVYFTVQPGGTFVFPDGARVVYPNYTKLPPGETVDFWNYDPERQGWHVYGHGKVSADATQVVPDPGTKVWSFYGGMFNTSSLPPWLRGWFKDVWDWINGDPVQLSTGQLMDSRTDLAVDDVMPIEVTRTLYQGDTANRDFGIGQLGAYNAFLHSAEQYQEVDLYLPGGAIIHYDRTSPGVGFADAVFGAVDTPGEYRGSTISRDNTRDGWELRRRDGMRYFFPQYAPLAEIRDHNDNTITLTRDSDLNLIQITSPNGKWIKLAYNPQRRVTGLRDNIGRTVGYTYNAGGRLETVTDTGGKVLRYTYDTAGRMLTATDARGIAYLTNEYDTAGRVAKQTLTDGQIYTFDYVTDTAGKITETRVTQPNGAVQRVTFNAAGAATSQTEAYGTAEASTTTFTRGTGERLDAMTDSAGRVTSFSYDGEGRLTQSTRLAGTAGAVNGEKTVYGGPFDLPSAITDELGKTTTYTYDDNGNLIEETDPLGRVSKTRYNSAGQVLTATDAAGKVTVNTYRLGDLRTSTDPTGRVTRFFTDNAGRVTQTADPAGAVSAIAYDARNQIASATDPLGRTYGFGYDENGNRTRLTDPRNNSMSWEYDASDRVTKVTDPLGRSTVTTYDGAGQVATTTNRNGKLTKFAYDALGRTKKVDYGVSGTTAESTVVFTYDEADRLKRISDTAAGGDTVFTYDDLDRVTRVTRPAGQVDYGYDAVDRRTSVTVLGRTPVTYDYDDTGAVKRIARGNVAVTPHYDDAGREDRLDLPGGWSQSYGYDDAGRVTGITYRHGTADKGGLAYGYDPLGQISDVTGSLAKVALPSAVSGMVYDAANRLTGRSGQTLSYDFDGNLTGDGTATYNWNARGQLTGLSRAGLTAGFRYDAEGQRDRRTVNGAVTGYLSAGDNPIAETDASGNVTAELMSGAIDQWFGRTTSSGTQTYLTDLQGSTLALGADDGSLRTAYSYDPNGGTTVTGDPAGNGFTYTGREDDGTGLLFYRARYYSPTLGRFISEDPIGVDGGANLYGYAAGDPVNATDPSGNNPLLAACAGGALFGGGMEYLTQRLSGRKVDWGSVGTQAVIGCGLGMFGKAFQLGKAAQCVGNSFTGDTPVLMADGTHKPISDVRVGELVTVTDPETGTTRGEPVTALIQGVGSKRLVRLTVDLDGDRGTATGTVTATDGHPFWVPDRRDWVEAGDLVPGTWLRTSAGTHLQVGAVRKLFRWDRVYNLTVGETHTYYVAAGAADLLVHNGACPKAAWLGKANFTSQKTMSKKFDAHAAQFGITGNRNKASMQAFEKAMRDHMAAPGTKIYRFDYRGQGIAVGFIDTSSGKMVMLHADGTFWSAWNLGAKQLAGIIDKGFLY